MFAFARTLLALCPLLVAGACRSAAPAGPGAQGGELRLVPARPGAAAPAAPQGSAKAAAPTSGSSTPNLAAPAAAPSLSASATTDADGARPVVVTMPGAPLSLGAFYATRPACPNDASEAEVVFCRAATRAWRATFEDDRDDGAQLLALLNQLEVRAELARLGPIWTSALYRAHARAALLDELSAPLRRLRRALANAYLDPRTNLYRGVRLADCKKAFVELEARTELWPDLVVTVEPLGTWPLSTLQRFCLLDRRLPAQ